jgi:hypothetical protein
VRAVANEEGVLDGPDEHCHVVGVGEIVCLYYHRVLNINTAVPLEVKKTTNFMFKI